MERSRIGTREPADRRPLQALLVRFVYYIAAGSGEPCGPPAAGAAGLPRGASLRAERGAPDAQAQPGAPAAPEAPNTMPQPAPGSRPIPITGLPAGAVLVAVQNTSVSARTDEAGKFTLSGVPAGQYMTVAAGPVANESSATAERPNVFVNGGESVDVGTRSLGGRTAPGRASCFGLGNPPARRPRRRRPPG